MRLFLAGVLILVSQAVFAAPHVVSWETLKDPVAGHYDDPFAALHPSQLRSLGQILRLREGLKAKGLKPDERSDLEGELEREEALLVVTGVDVDGLLSRRQQIAIERARASLAGNKNLAGQEVTIRGYVIPVLGEDDKAVGGYLVPERGMCSHIPPPDPNQMVRYKLSGGQAVNWAADYIYEPVELTGRLTLGATRQEITLLDGQVEMISAFQMDVDKAVRLDDSAPAPEERGFNFFSSVKRLLKRRNLEQ